jgi:hypothetical protein
MLSKIRRQNAWRRRPGANKVKKIEYEDEVDYREPSRSGSLGCLPVKRGAMVYGRSSVKRNPVKVRDTPNVITGSIKGIV